MVNERDLPASVLYTTPMVEYVAKHSHAQVLVPVFG